MEHSVATKALSALGHETRLAIFRLLVQAGPAGKLAGEIASTLTLPGPTLSFHLKELAAVGMIRAEQNGRTVCYRADFDTMARLLDYLTENCCGSGVSCGDRRTC